MKDRTPDTRKMFRALTVTLGADSYTLYNNCIAAATSIHEAVFVSWFLWMWDKKSYWNEKDQVQEMFIVEKDFCRFTHLPANGFRTIVTKWEKKKIIQTVIKHAPPKKYYRLDEERFTSYVTAMMEDSNSEETKELTPKKPRVNSEETKELTPKKLGRYIKAETESPSTKGKKEDTVAGTERARRRPAKSLVLSGMDKARKTPQRRLSISLYKIVYPHLKGLPNQLPKPDKDTGKKNWKSWDREFHQLLQALTFDEVTEVMEWYGQNYGGDFVPEIESARSFRQKFHKLLAAMKRQRADAERQKERRQQELRQDGLDEDPQPTADDLNNNSPYFQYTDEELEEMRREEDRELEESRLRHERNHRKTRRTRK